MRDVESMRQRGARCDELLLLLRGQHRQSEELFSDARAVWRDRAAERTWKRNIEPQLAGAERAQERLQLQAERHAAAVAHAQTTAERLSAALVAAETALVAVRDALENARVSRTLAADAGSEAAAADAAVAEVMARVATL